MTLYRLFELRTKQLLSGGRLVRALCHVAIEREILVRALCHVALEREILVRVLCDVAMGGEFVVKAHCCHGTELVLYNVCYYANEMNTIIHSKH